MEVSEVVHSMMEMDLKTTIDVSSPFDEMDMSAKFWAIDPTYIHDFTTHAFEVAQLPLDFLIYPLLYLERFLNHCGFAMTSANFRPVWLVSLLLATKMCDDRGLCNEDFAWMFPNLCTCRMLNLWEHLYLSVLSWEFYISASQYATCFFKLQHLQNKKSYDKGEVVGDKPLDLEAASYIHALPGADVAEPHSGQRSPSVRSQSGDWGPRRLYSPQESPKNQLSPRGKSPGIPARTERSIPTGGTLDALDLAATPNRARFILS